VKYFFLLRVRQIVRIFVEIGILRSLILLVLSAFAVFKLVLFTKDHEVLIASVAFLSILSVHFKRKDKKLLTSIFDQPFFIYLVEYFFISTPSLLALAAVNGWLFFSALILSILILSFTNYEKAISVSAAIKGSGLLSRLPVEWTSGLRRSWPGFIILYVIALFSYSYSTAIPLLIVISVIIICSFFNECEPYQLVDLYHRAPFDFLKLKYIQHLKVFWILYSPLLLFYTFFFPQYWFVFFVVFVVCSTLIVLTISTKYSSYLPNEELGMNSILIIISLCCFLIPFLSPIPFFLVIRNHRRAVKNLETYLYAFHQ
jgi:hypothetical protein